MKNYQNKIEIFVKLVSGICETWKNCRKVKCWRTENFQEENSLKTKTRFWSWKPKFRNYRNKAIVWMSREIFENAESVPSGPSHVPSQPELLPPYRDPGGMLSRSVGMPSRNDKPPDIWDAHGTSGKFLQIHERLLRHFIQEDSILGFITWRKTHLYSQVRDDPLHMVNVRFQTQSWLRDCKMDRPSEIHSPLKREDSQIIIGQTNKDCRSRNFILTNSLIQQHLHVGR